MLSLLAIVGFTYLLGAYAYIGPIANLVIGNKVIAPDGYPRSSVLAGAFANSLDFPGPVISAIKGDNFRLNVFNQLTDRSMLMSTSIHWHGLYQKGSSWADGTVGVTQCPITPGHSFLYEFSSANQAGTFWYHSHYSTQYCDGLRGAMVVYDPYDPYKSWYDYDDESTIITLADWYHTPAPKAGLIPTPNATLINGKGRYPGGKPVALSVVRVVPNRRYRFRLISISCDPAYTFSIDNHPMTIIEVDSENVQPLVVDSITIFAGQRYSFILYSDKPIRNYWIRSSPQEGLQGFEEGINSAILRYWGAPTIDPKTTSSAIRPLGETDLRPLTNPGAPGIPARGAADVNINLDISFNPEEKQFSVNNVPFVDTPIPVLLQILSGAQAATDLLPAGSVYKLPPNNVIEISMPGGSAGSPHPMHLHGHTFSVVRSANSSKYNYANPVKRDVVSLGESTTDNVTIRFKTDNSGPWIMHCHIDWHLEAGLSVVFAEDIHSIKSSWHPPSWDQLCPIFNAIPHQTFN